MQSANRGPHDPAAYDLRSRKRARWQDFAANLEQEVNAAMPTLTTPFGRVAVLFMTWANDDLNLKPLNDQLKTVFQTRYNFACESYVIPNTFFAQNSLENRLTKFIQDWDSADSLTIFFYGGHARVNNKANPKTWMWGGTSKAQHQLDWFAIRGNVERPEGKVLYIFDTCYSGSGAGYQGPEILAASSWETMAPVAHHNSFTQCLIDELQRLNGDAQSVLQIFATITRSRHQSNIQAMPVHILKIGDPSVILTKLSEKPTKPSDLASQTQNTANEFRVLIAIRVEDTVNPPTLANWRKWLTTNMPSGLLSARIAIEGAFHGKSTSPSTHLTV